MIKNAVLVVLVVVVMIADNATVYYNTIFSRNMHQNVFKVRRVHSFDEDDMICHQGIRQKTVKLGIGIMMM